MRAGLLAAAMLITAGSALAGSSPRPILFEENRGQASAHARFLARDGASTLLLADDSAELRLGSGSDSPPDVLTMRLRGARTSAPRGEQRRSAAIHYFVGRGRNEWQTGIPAFGAIRYPGVYPNVDLLYHASSGALEYDFEVRPGGDPRAIRVAFEGATSVSLSERGALVITTSHGTVHQPRPFAFQVVRGRRKPVAAEYALANGNEVAFRIGRYDQRRPLVIDPVIRYSTYLGGDGRDEARAIATDAGGNTYVAGCTASTDFPHAPGPARHRDAYVTKIDATGSAIVYTTILGGAFDDCAGGIAVAADGSAHVTGYTSSEDFPVRNALQPASGGWVDAFVTALTPDGTLRYSSYLGGEDVENAPELGGSAIAIDAEGAAYVTGHTGSFNFPVTDGAVQRTLANSIDAFVAKVDTTREGAESLVYATYLGGTSFDVGSGISVDRAGSAYVTGNAMSPDFPVTPHAFQRNFAGHRFGDAFLAKLDPAGATLSYATYLGGSDYDRGKAVAVDDSGHAYVVATTESIDFPTVQPLQTAGGGFFKSDDSGERWRKSNTGLRTSLIRTLAADPAHPGRLYAGSDRGMYRSDDSGESWREINSGLPLDEFGELDVQDIAVDPNSRIFAGTTDGLYRSDDGGMSWVRTDDGLPLSFPGTVFVDGIALDPRSPGTLYVALTSLGNNVHRSLDSGRTWEAIDSSAPTGQLTVFNGALEVDPHRGSIYAGSFGQIFRSDDRGATWQSLTSGLPNSSIYAIAFHPQDPDVIYAASITEVFTSTDRGATWTRTSDGLGDLIIAELVVDPDDPSTLYVTGEANGIARVAASAGNARKADADADPVNGGIFKSTDGGRHWRPANAGLESNGWGALATVGGGVIWAGAAVRADVAVTKLSPDGSEALFSTYVSGRDHDFPAGAVIRCGNRLVIAGSTMSSDYPLRAPIQPERRGHLYPDAFVTELSLSGNAILFSTFAGSPDEEELTGGVAADCNGNIYLAGDTYARQFPLVSPLQPGHAGGATDAFVMKIHVEQQGRRRAVRR